MPPHPERDRKALAYDAGADLPAGEEDLKAYADTPFGRTVVE